MKPANTTRVLLISYHYFAEGPYRPRVLHEALRQELQGEYQLLCSDWDHLRKARHMVGDDSHLTWLRVPGYTKNLSASRVWSHVVFSWKLLFSSALWRANLVIVCVPPTLSAAVAIAVTKLRRRPVVVDVIDLWPEALPASPRFKQMFMWSGGWLWAGARNVLLKFASLVLCHCRYFAPILQRSFGARTKYMPLTQSDPSLFSLPSQRLPLSQECRILVLGSINHVLDSDSLLRLVASLVEKGSFARIVLEVIGDGETKSDMLKKLQQQSPAVKVMDHGVLFDSQKKGEILARCHFGYNGYKNTTAIGITYKSIDFASAGLVFLNSVQGDLNDLVKEYGAGFNYRVGDEVTLATRLTQLSDQDWQAFSRGAKKMAQDLFHPERLRADLREIIADGGVKL